jgi:ligand-binding SRPBCC domain-containing protein
VTHRLSTHLEIARPLDDVFAFFAQAENLERITPPELGFTILTPSPIEIRQGTLIDYQIRLFGVPVRWKTEIAVWTPPHEFVDVQLRGPYREWIHTHRFEATATGTSISDDVRYQLPLSPLGDLVHPLVRRQLSRVFAYRASAVGRLLGASPTATF